MTFEIGGGKTEIILDECVVKLLTQVCGSGDMLSC